MRRLYTLQEQARGFRRAGDASQFAGLRYSRTKARALSKMQDLSDAMEGIEYPAFKRLLDEIPAAYKDIDEVMENAKDLVEVKFILKQFINVKGD